MLSSSQQTMVGNIVPQKPYILPPPKQYYHPHPLSTTHALGRTIPIISNLRRQLQTRPNPNNTKVKYLVLKHHLFLAKSFEICFNPLTHPMSYPMKPKNKCCISQMISLKSC